MAAAAVTLFLLGACARTDAIGAPSASSSSGTPEGGAPADQLVLRVEQTGGFVGMNTVLTRLPMVSVYGDGRVLTQGPQIAVYPGPALPNLQVQLAPPSTVDALIAKGKQLTTLGDLGQPNIADATTTEITVDGLTITAYALSETQSSDPSLTAAQRDARAKLAAFVDQLSALSEAKGMPAVQQYQPTAVAVVASPWVKPAGDLPSAPAATPWPGPALPGTLLQPEGKVGCLTVTGDEASKVLAAAENANQNTPWTSGSATWNVTFRPLLPDEAGCADLQGKR